MSTDRVMLTLPDVVTIVIVSFGDENDDHVDHPDHIQVLYRLGTSPLKYGIIYYI